MAADRNAVPEKKDPGADGVRGPRTPAEADALLAAEVERVRNDGDFVARVRDIIASDQELLDRLAE